MMNKLISGPISIVLASVLLTGCEPEFSNAGGDLSSGNADFSTFISVGDSITAGYADGALYRHGQINSYPAILAQQFAKVGGGVFTQPLMPIGGTGSLTLTPIGNLGLIDRLVLVPTMNPARPASPSAITPVQTTSIDTRVGAGGFNNLGVPGAKSFHLGAPNYGELSPAAIGGGSANPFFSRFSSSDGTTVLTDALTMAPSFFVLWIGNNDILSYATDGGAAGVDRTDDPVVTGYGPDDITDPGFFEDAMGYPALVGALTSGGAKGVLVNIPDVTTIPYFTTVPYNAIPLSSADAMAANAGFALYNLGVTNMTNPMSCNPISADEALQRQISFSAGQNPVVILDENLTDITCFASQLVNMRQATANDFIVLPTSSKLGTDAGGGLIWGVSAPLLDEDVLIESEVTAVENARTRYNAAIKTAADASPDLVFLDASALLTKLNTTGISYGTGGISSTFAQGGGFSLDGVHPTARGYAVIANEIIKVINDGFAANIPLVDPSTYSTVFYQ